MFDLTPTFHVPTIIFSVVAASMFGAPIGVWLWKQVGKLGGKKPS